jgi:hypothetical protein
MAKPFEDARLQIERAKQNINDLHALVRDSLEKYSYSIIVERDAKAGYDLLRLEAPQIMPVEFSRLLANILRNLREALDSAWLNIAFDNTSVTEFPVYQTRNDLESAVENTLKHEASEDIVKFIVDVVQPYERGDGELILALHGLDVKAQQGRSLHLDHQFIRGIRAVDGGGEEFTVPDFTFVPPHSFAHRCEGRTNVKITDNGKPMLFITFNDRLPMEGQPILPSLSQMVVFISGTINCLETKFLAV